VGALRILIVDDHEATRTGIRRLLSAHSDWDICGEAVDGLDAVEKVRSLQPQLVLMDISMPHMSGIEASRIIRSEMRGSEIVLVSQNDPAVVQSQAAEVGALGYVPKDELPSLLVPMIEKIAATMAATSRPAWLAVGGELRDLIATKDWSQTALGPLEKWPYSLQVSVSLMLNSQHPIWIGWGETMSFLYNDAYIPVLSAAKHPRSLGKPAAQVWAEIWHLCGPLADRVFSESAASYASDVQLFMDRGDFLEETFYSFSYSPILDESGRVVGLFCPSTDTTAKNLNARRLRTLSELSAKALVARSIQSACSSAMSILSSNSDDIPFAALYMADAKGETAHLEQTTLGDGGIGALPRKASLQGNSTDEPWPFAEVFRTLRAKAVSVGRVEGLPPGAAGQRITEAMVLPVTSSGETKPLGILLLGASPARRLDDEYRTFFHLIADQVATAIYSAKAAEQEKMRADALAELDRAKTIFFNNVSHEFRTPLTLLMGPLEDTIDRPQSELAAGDQENLRLAHRNGLRLEKLVNTLLDFSRLEAGRAEASYQPTDLAQFTAELASCFQSTMSRAGLRFEVICQSLAEPVYVDRDMWEKIVLNLLSNAFKFTLHGTVAVRLKPAGPAVELEVSDTGVGIPEAELPRVFERFHRVEGTHGRTHEGSGIGLALVQELVRLHGGTIHVRSTAGKGTTFTVTIPKGNGHLPPERIETPRALASSAIRAETFVQEALGWLPNQLGDNIVSETTVSVEGQAQPGAASARELILLVDDNADMRDYVRRLLGAKYQVHAVPNGRQALKAAQKLRPDLILSDVMMPDLDGFGLLREIRNDSSLQTTPVILVSARAGEEERIVGLRAGADDYITKPFSARELLARVEGTLAIAKIRMQSTAAIREREERLRSLADSLEEKVRQRTNELEMRNTEILQKSKQLRELSARLMQARDEERRHIARELHDSAGQSLTALGLNLARLANLAQSKAPEMASEAEESQRLAQQLSQEIRTMAYLLHPPMLDENGLGGALRWYIHGATERSGVVMTLDIAPDFGRLPREIELIVFRTVQECLTNIHRHSESKTAFIRVLRSPESVTVEVKDDGRGIAPDRLAEIQKGAQGSGVGINGMRERVLQQNGTMAVQSNGRGTRVFIELPLEAQRVLAEDTPTEVAHSIASN
jgi:signal transduction histidine kinase